MNRRTINAPLLLATVFAMTLTAHAIASGPEFDDRFGSDQIGPSAWSITADDSGNVYTTEFNADHVLKFRRDGVYMKSWGTNGSGPGQFDRPYQIAYHPTGVLLVADHFNNRVQKFDTDGGYLDEWAVSTPRGVAVHPNGTIYVQSLNTLGVSVFDIDGNLQTTLSNPGILSHNLLHIDLRGVLYGAHAFGGPPRKYTENGDFLGFVGSEGTQPGQFDYAAGMTSDDHGNLFAVDFALDRVQVFDSTGTFLYTWGPDAFLSSRVRIPHDVLWLPGDTIYVFERGMRDISRYLGTDCPPAVEVLTDLDQGIIEPDSILLIEWDAGDDVEVTSVDISYVRDQRLLAVSTAGSGQPSTLEEVHPVFLEFNPIGPIGFNGVQALDTDPKTGVLYAHGERPSDNDPVLIRIDPETGAGTEIGASGYDEVFADLAFDPVTNALYGITDPTTGSEELHEINKYTGESTPIGATMTDGGRSTLEFDANGQLWMTLLEAGVANLHKVATATGEAFDPVELNFSPSLTNNPFLLDMDRNPKLPWGHCLFRDNTTAIWLGTIQFNSSPPLVSQIATEGGLASALSWHPGTEISIATGEPNDGSYLWTVPDDPTNSARIKVRAHDNGGNSTFDFSEGFFAILNTVDVPADWKRGTFLAAPAPNPSRSSVAIRYGLAARGDVELAVYDVRGRLVRRLVSGIREAGEHSLTWDGRSASGALVASGQYYLRLRTPRAHRTESIQIVR